jgi:hypothetical protein
MKIVRTVRLLDKFFIPEITEMILDYMIKGLWDYDLPSPDSYREQECDSFTEFLRYGHNPVSFHYSCKENWDEDMDGGIDELHVMDDFGCINISVPVRVNEYEDVYNYLRIYFDFL